eukprot:2739337-Rhodomonas_salina.2
MRRSKGSTPDSDAVSFCLDVVGLDKTISIKSIQAAPVLNCTTETFVPRLYCILQLQALKEWGRTRPPVRTYLFPYCTPLLPTMLCSSCTNVSWQVQLTDEPSCAGSPPPLDSLAADQGQPLTPECHVRKGTPQWQRAGDVG